MCHLAISREMKAQCCSRVSNCNLPIISTPSMHQWSVFFPRYGCGYLNSSLSPLEKRRSVKLPCSGIVLARAASPQRVVSLRIPFTTPGNTIDPDLNGEDTGDVEFAGIAGAPIYSCNAPHWLRGRMAEPSSGKGQRWGGRLVEVLFNDVSAVCCRM